MNKWKLFRWALLCLWLSAAVRSQAQTQTADERFVEAMSALDMAPVLSSTGLFADRVPSIVPLELFRGRAISDTLHGSRGLLLISQATMYGADLGSSPLPEPQAYRAQLDIYEQSDTVVFGTLLYQYDRLKPTVMDDNILYYDGIRFQHTDPNAAAEAYRRDTLAVLAALQTTITSQTVSFVLPAALYATNMNSITAIDIDYGDGLGFRPLVPGQVAHITYSTADTFRIDIRYTLTGGDVRYASTRLIVEDATTNFDRGLIGGLRSMMGYSHAPDRSQHVGTQGAGCTIFIWDNKDCGKKIRKPLILIKGFDPSNSIQPDYVMNGADALLDKPYDILDSNGESAFLKDLIHDEGYTLFFITMDNSTARIQDNAAATKLAINWINAQKRAAGSSEKNVVIGASMGGLIGKWVLREYEINGDDHETELFISFDSPLKGANIPLALQAIPVALGTQNVLFGTELRHLKGELDDGFKALTSPAARQMLYYSLGPCRSGCTAAELSAEHTTFFTEFEARDNLEIPHIALSNGSMTGEGMTYGPGTQLIKSDQFNADWILNLIGYVTKLIPFYGNDLVLEVEGYALPGVVEHGEYVVAKNAWKYKRFGIQIFSVTEVISLNSTDAAANSLPGYIWYDTAPGALKEFQSGGKPQGWQQRSFCFIPTVSALDLPMGANPFTNVSDLSVLADLAPQLRSALASEDSRLYYGVQQTNMTHVSLNNKLATFLLSSVQSLELSELLSLSSRTFNFGRGDYNYQLPLNQITTTSHFIRKNLNITKTGKLWINRNNRIAYTDVAENIHNSIGSHFDVYIQDNCNQYANIVQVMSGGEMSIGDWSEENTGRLIISSDQVLHVKSGGKLIIDNKSSIVVKKGATLVLDAGSEVNILGDGFIDVEDGGRLVVSGDSKIYLEKPMGNFAQGIDNRGSVIVQNGLLDALDGVIHIQGRGFLWIRNGAGITSTGAGMTWRGHGKELTAFRVDSEVNLNNKNFLVSQAHIMVNQSIMINGGNCSLVSSKFTTSSPQGFESLPESALFQAFQNYGKVGIRHNNINDLTIERCEFEDVPVFASQFRSAFLDMVHSTTANKILNFEFNSGSKLMVRNSFITTGGLSVPFVSYPLPNMTKIGVSNISVFESKFQNTEISEFNRNNGRGPDPYADIQYTGIRQQTSPYLYLDDCVISQCEKGIYAPDAVNIVMNHSRISDSHIGIEMTGSASTGLVKMMCSQLINNHTGVSGSDITLAIDAIINSQTTKSGGFTENYFDNTDAHFRICYKDKDFDWEIPARRNVWVNPTKYRLGFCPSGNDAELVQYPEGGGSCPRQDINSCEDKTPDFPIVNKTHAPSDYAELCLYQKTCHGDTILSKYWRGFTCYYNDDLQHAIYHLTPLAQDRYTIRDMNEKYLCTQITAEAHAFVGGQFEYTETDEDNNLIISDICRADAQGQKHHILTVDIPAFMLPVSSIDWYEYDGGQVLGSKHTPTVNTNGSGRYVVNVRSADCLYTTTFNYEIHEIDCEEVVECPEINSRFYEDEDCLYKWEISSTSFQTLKFVITTYNTDPENPQFTDTVIFNVSPGLNFFCYDDLPSDQWCYNYQDMYIYCESCTQTCTPFYEHYACIPKPSSTSNLESENKILVYPNPFTHGLQMKVNTAFEGDIFIEGYNPTGQKIFSDKRTLTEENRHIHLKELNDLKPGMYMLKINYDKHQVIKKVIKTN